MKKFKRQIKLFYKYIQKKKKKKKKYQKKKKDQKKILNIRIPYLKLLYNIFNILNIRRKFYII